MIHDATKLLHDSGSVNTIELLWQFLRRGVSLLLLFNIPIPQPLPVESPLRSRAATSHFLSICVRYLNIPAADCFTMQDLYDSNIMGFVRVIKFLNRVLSILYQNDHGRPSILKTPREFTPIVTTDVQSPLRTTLTNFLKSERSYVYGLEKLLEIQRNAELLHLITESFSRSHLIELDRILDFQQRFLIQVKELYHFGADVKSWFELFVRNWAKFQVVVPYIRSLPSTLEQTVQFADKLNLVLSIFGQQQSNSFGEFSSLKALMLAPALRLLEYEKISKDLSGRPVVYRKWTDALANILLPLENPLFLEADVGFIDLTSMPPFHRQGLTRLSLTPMHSRSVSAIKSQPVYTMFLSRHLLLFTERQQKLVAVSQKPRQVFRIQMKMLCEHISVTKHPDYEIASELQFLTLVVLFGRPSSDIISTRSRSLETRLSGT
ncbi:uncharacterized protein BDZ99DRAFT_239852 [Mytilinidion resinicola]|uniref:DH domain-containing protein n=1 Tax=Mytilinidion resinicola TaxID=574789 RepID=A0A6A6XYA1_9PEZI|nr:uncharacterized protein BDZ99DRAFT_239852 [Mytilinidion resinicola]KAF2801400.1 hypothetical protein BDZ99DRAFT_239852 [Mytilinidion resinicola]